MVVVGRIELFVDGRHRKRALYVVSSGVSAHPEGQRRERKILGSSWTSETFCRAEHRGINRIQKWEVECPEGRSIKVQRVTRVILEVCSLRHNYHDSC